MDQVRKGLIKKTIVDILTKNINYPNCDEDQILSQLKPCWIALEEAGLVQGLSFQAFQQHAVSAAQMSKIQKMFGV